MFIDESGFLLIPNVVRTWAPRGCTPRVYHLYSHERLSAISALTVSPHRRHVGLYLQFQGRAFNGLDVRAFLADLLRHLRGPIVILWDRGSIHRRREVTAFLRLRPRVQVEYFPGYTPELNPAEFVWTRGDRNLANSAPSNVQELRQLLNRSYRRMRGSQQLLWACIFASDLPWAR